MGSGTDEVTLRIPCSPEQEDVIADHLFDERPLGMQPDERAWITSHVRRQYPQAKIVGADLDVAGASWIVTIISNKV